MIGARLRLLFRRRSATSALVQPATGRDFWGALNGRIQGVLKHGQRFIERVPQLERGRRAAPQMGRHDMRTTGTASLCWQDGNSGQLDLNGALKGAKSGNNVEIYERGCREALQNNNLVGWRDSGRVGRNI